MRDWERCEWGGTFEVLGRWSIACSRFGGGIITWIIEMRKSGGVVFSG